MKIKVEKIFEDAIVPHRSNPTDSGLDVCANNVKKVFVKDVYNEIEEQNKSLPLMLKPNQRALIGTGIACTFGKFFEIQVRPRSGLALKHGISIVNTPGTIDESYTGEIGVILINHSNTPFEINKGDRIAQIVVAPVILCDVQEVSKLDDTKRGDDGFGSTGS